MRIIFGFIFVLLLLMPLWNKARVWKIVSAFLCICFLLWLWLFVSLLPLKKVPEMTQEKAQKFFETVGGVDTVNREARVLFDRFGTNEWKFLFAEDLKDTPAISTLRSKCENYSGKKYGGTGMEISSEGGTHIQISFGNHFWSKAIFIFDPNKAVTLNSASNYFQVASNIFFSK